MKDLSESVSKYNSRYKILLNKLAESNGDNIHEFVATDGETIKKFYDRKLGVNRISSIGYMFLAIILAVAMTVVYQTYYNSQFFLVIILVGFAGLSCCGAGFVAACVDMTITKSILATKKQTIVGLGGKAIYAYDGQNFSVVHHLDNHGPDMVFWKMVGMFMVGNFEVDFALPEEVDRFSTAARDIFKKREVA